MRVLFASTAHQGHLRPMLPLALALRELGHEVAWVSGPDAQADLTAFDLRSFVAGASRGAYSEALARAWPERSRLDAQQASETHFARLFGGVVAPAMLAGIGEAIDRWKPELVINGAATLAAPLACRLRGLPHVTHGFGLPTPQERLDDAVRRFRPGWQQAGWPEEPGAGLYAHRYIDIGPPAWRTGVPGPSCPTWALRPAQPQAKQLAGLPDSIVRLIEAGGRPLVYFSFGTAFNLGAAFGAALRALSRAPARVVVALGPQGRADPAIDLPAHVVAVPWVNLERLLPWCAAVVSHGGAGTVLAALAHGMPQLCLPQGADQFRNGQGVVQAGAGLMLRPDESDDEAIAAAVCQVLCSPALAGGAGRLAAQVAAMPSALAVARAVTRTGRNAEASMAEVS